MTDNDKYFIYGVVCAAMGFFAGILVSATIIMQ